LIDHVSLPTQDLARSVAFYEPLLATLGYQRGLYRPGFFCVFNFEKKPEFWLSQATQPFGPLHLAFRAKSQGAVQAFYQVGLDQGAKDNGRPGYRPQYHPDYYAAFILDLDGYNLEAVVHHR